MKLVKKILSLFLCITFLFSLTIVSSATDSDVSKNQKKLISTIKITEYEMLQQLQGQSDEALKEKGLTATEIKEIKNFNYFDALKKRAAIKNNKELEGMGYSENDIEILKDPNSSESELIALSATVTFSVWEYGHFLQSALSEVYLETDWSWDIWPTFGSTDIVAICWSNNLYCNTNTQKPYETYAEVSYYDIGSTYRGYSQLTVIAETNLGAHVKIPLRKKIGNYEYFALNGYMQTYIQKKAYVPQVSVYAKYGHSTVTVTPTVSFKGYPSIEFAPTMTEAAEDDEYIDLTIPY